MSSIFVARQPIFELGRGLYGYELLYRRDAATDCADGEDGYMSAEVIVASLLGIGLPAISGGGIAFVNFSRGQLRNKSWELFQPGSVIIELLETVDCDDETLAACRQMVKAGHKLALDDYVYDEESAPLLELASIVKVDVLGRTPAQLLTIANQLKPSGVRLLAERVETATIRDLCADMGFELFQGYLFSRPQMLTKTDVSPSQLSIMRLLNLLQDPNTSDLALDAAFQSDIALCYKLLRIVNAASVGGRGISSIPHAVRMVGREMLHRWLAVILVASLGRKGDVTHELALTAITRGRMCELLAAGNADRRYAGSAFIVGLLSLLDVLLEVPMEKILARLELSPDVRGALLERSGPLGTPLKLVESYEKAEWESAKNFAAQTTVPEETLPEIYLDALQWAALRLTMT
jgi:EAL and modified HD-GYP domain-containing signal transduction protein